MKKTLLILFLSCFSLSAKNSLLIQGRALNGSADSTALAGLSVALHKMSTTGDLTLIDSSRTDRNGGFRFLVSQPDSSADYYLAAEHQAARYFSDAIRIAAGAERVPAQIVVFDSTRHAGSVSILMHHVFLEDAGASVRVREMRVLHNPLTKTILDALADRNATLALELPPAAENFTGQGLHFDGELTRDGHTVYFMDILLPGNRQIGYEYELPWHDNQVTLTLTSSMATRAMDFFLANPEWSASVQGLLDRGPFKIRESTVHRYGAQNLRPGDRVQMVIARKNIAGKQQPWYAIGITGLLLVLAVVASAIKQNRTRRDHRASFK